MCCFVLILSAFFSAYRLKNFQIGTTNTSPEQVTPAVNNYDVCATYRSAMGQGQYMYFSCTAQARYVIIQLKGRDILTLCEVEVFEGRYI